MNIADHSSIYTVDLSPRDPGECTVRGPQKLSEEFERKYSIIFAVDQIESQTLSPNLDMKKWFQ